MDFPPLFGLKAALGTAREVISKTAHAGWDECPANEYWMNLLAIAGIERLQ